MTTAYEYLEKRFSPFVRVLCSLSFILYQVGRMGVVLLLPSIALNVVTGLDIFVCIAVGQTRFRSWCFWVPPWPSCSA